MSFVFKCENTPSLKLTAISQPKMDVLQYVQWLCLLNFSKYTLQGTNISHLGKRKIIFKSDFWWDMLIPRRVYIRVRIYVYILFHHSQCTSDQDHRGWLETRRSGSSFAALVRFCFLDSSMKRWGFSMFFGAEWKDDSLMFQRGPMLCFFWVVGKHLWQLFCFLFNSQELT